MENYNDNVENVCGYTVHSFYIDGPEHRKKSAPKQKCAVLRHFVFVTLAPFAILADTLVSIFH
ncbi:MAG: hypothetical protein IJW21_05935 [Clostridia bacterium]|nr:hypothetical protein [Clostridia bacterium]